ncbi:hypothetical protein [Brevundimonas sp.]|uniref:hypothetical protein n=1 Tax=Brevundimonas sp. TaxID=1871086 RepID=UPI003F6FF44C
MPHYTLDVFNEGDSVARQSVALMGAKEVLDMIPSLLVKYPDCFRIHARLGTLRLFSVDCEGKTVRD